MGGKLCLLIYNLNTVNMEFFFMESNIGIIDGSIRVNQTILANYI